MSYRRVRWSSLIVFSFYEEVCRRELDYGVVIEVLGEVCFYDERMEV